MKASRESVGFFRIKVLQFIEKYDIITKLFQTANRGISSAGRALHWQCRGQRFEPAMLHQLKIQKPCGFLDFFFYQLIAAKTAARSFFRYYKRDWLRSARPKQKSALPTIAVRKALSCRHASLCRQSFPLRDLTQQSDFFEKAELILIHKKYCHQEQL